VARETCTRRNGLCQRGALPEFGFYDRSFGKLEVLAFQLSSAFKTVTAQPQHGRMVRLPFSDVTRLPFVVFSEDHKIGNPIP
jgi:hypothetical protein